jgi:hypothetical protein
MKKKKKLAEDTEIMKIALLLSSVVQTSRTGSSSVIMLHSHLDPKTRVFTETLERWKISREKSRAAAIYGRCAVDVDRYDQRTRCGKGSSL